MNFILQNLIAALLPVGIDGVKQLIGKFTGGDVRASNVAEQIQLEDSQIKKLTALASLDNPYGTPSQWVIDLRGSFRYVAAGAIILIGFGIQFATIVDPIFRAAGLDFAGMAFSFVFGDRVRLALADAKR